MSEFKMGQFNLSEYATMAEQIAKQKVVEKETLARMQAEAMRLNDELADALFAPYVGKQIRLDYGKRYTLLRYPHYTKRMQLFAFNTTSKGQGDEPGARPDHHSLRGWLVSVVWDDKGQRMRASLSQDGQSTYINTKAIEGGDGDLGTQAIRLAQALAQQIGERLVLDTPAQ